MKKAYKRILVGLGTLVFALVCFSVYYGVKVKRETKEMTPVETKLVVDNIYAIHESFVNMFLIEDSGKYIAIDAGNKSEDVLQEFKKLNINPDDVIAVLLTHSDGDHVGSLELFKNAKVHLAKEEEQLLTGETSRFFVFGNEIATETYSLLKDQEEFNIGNIKVKAIHVPGHTPGSMCYLVNDKYLFIGDACSIKNCEIEQFNEFFNMDTETAMKSLKNIAGLPQAEYIFSAHYGYCDDYSGAIQTLK